MPVFTTSGAEASAFSLPKLPNTEGPKASQLLTFCLWINRQADLELPRLPALLLIFNVHLLVIFPSSPGSPWKETNTPWKSLSHLTLTVQLTIQPWAKSYEHMCVSHPFKTCRGVKYKKTISYFLIKHLKGSCWASWPASLSSSMFYIPEEPWEILFNWLISTGDN